VHVSAKDLGTGNEQKVTITASTNLSEDDIQKAVREAEQFAAEDKKHKEEVEVKNHADSMIAATEKSMKEMGDKIPEADKAKINAEIENVKNAVSGGDVDNIRSATEKLTEVSYDVFGRVYQQQAQEQQAAGGYQQGGYQQGGYEQPRQNDDGVVDADYEVVDDNK
ncbi:MAG: Hsp70 family protein, partial [Clostridia bacterium]|nr:Hsp70 family protein [Clostridia bacterium]